MTEFGPVALFIFIAIGMVFFSLILGALIRPKNPYPAKNSSYECGELPVGSAWSRFDIRFYSIALLFILFEVEAILILPVAVVYREWLDTPERGLALAEILLFVFILLFALIYAWSRGDLDWVKNYRVGSYNGKNRRGGHN